MKQYLAPASIIILAACSAVLFFYVLVLPKGSATQMVVRYVEPITQPEYIPKVPVSNPMTMLFFGDVMLGRNVEARVKKLGDPRKLFDGMRDTLVRAVDRVINLEGPVMERHVVTPTGSVRFSFDRSIAQALVDEGFTFAGLANNHALDHGRSQFDETVTWLSGKGLLPFGGPSEQVTASAQVFKRQGQEFALLGFSTYPNLYTDEKMTAVAKVRKENPNAFIIVSIHWGDEYQLTANAQQRAFARKLIDAGTDIIIGSHPHVVQDVDLYKGKAIFYSLGNFIFDQYFSPETQEGLAVLMSRGATSTTYELVPFRSDMSIPQPLNDDERRSFLTALAARSTTTVREAVGAGFMTIPFDSGSDDR